MKFDSSPARIDGDALNLTVEFQDSRVTLIEKPAHFSTSNSDTARLNSREEFPGCEFLKPVTLDLQKLPTPAP